MRTRIFFLFIMLLLVGCSSTSKTDADAPLSIKNTSTDNVKFGTGLSWDDVNSWPIELRKKLLKLYKKNNWIEILPYNYGEQGLLVKCDTSGKARIFIFKNFNNTDSNVDINPNIVDDLPEQPLPIETEKPSQNSITLEITEMDEGIYLICDMPEIYCICDMPKQKAKKAIRNWINNHENTINEWGGKYPRMILTIKLDDNNEIRLIGVKKAKTKT